MELDLFNQSLLKRVQHLAVANGIEVVIDPESNGFSATENKLKMPPIANLAENFPQRDDLQAYVLGAVVHELGHIRCTNFNARRAFRRSFNDHPASSVAFNIGQYIEDAFVELQQMDSDSQNGTDLTAMWKLLFNKHGTHSGHVSQHRAFEEYVFYRCRSEVLRTGWAEEATAKAQMNLTSVLDSIESNQIMEMMDRTRSITCSEEGIALSVALLACMGITEETEGEASERQEPSDGIQDVSAPDGEDTSDGAVDRDQASKPAGGETVEDSGQSSLMTAAPAVLAASEIELIFESLPEDTQFIVELPSGVEGNGLASAPIKADATAGMVLRDKVLAHTMYAQAKLSSLLLAQTECAENYGRSGKIVPSRLWKLKCGNLRVFKRTVEGIQHSTSIHLLMDRSSSTEAQIEPMKEAAAFLPIAFDAFDGIDTAFSIFPGNGPVVETIKEYGDRISNQLDRVAGVCASGGTPLVAAVRSLVPSILEWEADRRYLIVVTDGELRNEALIRKQLAEVEAQGIHLVGIGVGVDVSPLFENHIKIRHSSELTDALYNLMLHQMSQVAMAA